MIGGIITLSILLIFSAFFSAAETAMVSISRLRLAQMLEEKINGVQALNRIRKEPGRMLTTILIGNNIANIWASVLAASLVFEYSKGITKEDFSFIVGVITGVMTFLILVFGEIVPKTIALRNAEKFALFAAPLILLIEFIFKPIEYLLTIITRPIVRIFGGPGEKSLTQEEIKMVISAGVKAGVLEQEEKEMISSVIEFSQTSVSEVMTPKPDIHAIELNQSIENLKILIQQVGRSRIPVYEGNLDNIVGVVYAKDLVALQESSIKEYLHPVLTVPESKMIDELLREMQSSHIHMAIIVDEYGSTSGIVTMEDLLEEIVGEIHDEFEKGAKRIEKIDAQTWLVDATLSIDDVKKELDALLPDGDYDTLAGFVLSQLGRLPSMGDAVNINSIKITVDKIYRRRIMRIKLQKIKPSGEEMVGG